MDKVPALWSTHSTGGDITVSPKTNKQTRISENDRSLKKAG
jgi:hypothetical protein